MKLTAVLEESIENLSTLKEYFEEQNDFLDNKFKKEAPKYKYGYILDRYLTYNLLKSKIKNFELPNFSEKVQVIIDEIMEEYNVSEKDDKQSISYKLKDSFIDAHPNYEFSPKICRNAMNKLFEQPKILGKSSLMMLLIYYERLISTIFVSLLYKYPQAYLKDKTITYMEIMELESNENDIKNYLVNNEVEALMRDSLSSWYAILNIKHKVNFPIEDVVFEEFKEIYYRRNLLVHNDGIVNKIYLENVDDSLLNGIKVGSRLTVSPDYFIKAINITLLMIYGTIMGLKKLCSDKEEVNDTLFIVGYNHLQNKEWGLSEYIFRNLKDDKELNNHTKMCCKVNYWISLKHMEHFADVKKDIEDLDVSAVSDEFKVAKYALLDDFEKVSFYLDKIINRVIPAEEIESWPLFIEYRESIQYLKFKEIHADDFDIKNFNEDEMDNNSTHDDTVKMEQLLEG